MTEARADPLCFLCGSFFRVRQGKCSCKSCLGVGEHSHSSFGDAGARGTEPKESGQPFPTLMIL